MSSSWYVEFLLRNRVNIRSNMVPDDVELEHPDTRDAISLEDVDEWRDEPSYLINFNDDVYNDLLIVEKKVKEMFLSRQITKKEMRILKRIMLGRNIVDVERDLNISRIWVSKTFSEVCDRIGYLLGGEFTDEGFLEYMKEKYQLQDSQMETMAEFLNSNKRHSFSTGGNNRGYQK